jgi:hypothetical protein
MMQSLVLVTIKRWGELYYHAGSRTSPEEGREGGRRVVGIYVVYVCVCVCAVTMTVNDDR